MLKLIKNYNPNYTNQSRKQTHKILNPSTKIKKRNKILAKSQSLNDIFITQRNKMIFQSQRASNRNKNKNEVYLNNNSYFNSKNSSEIDYNDSIINEENLCPQNLNCSNSINNDFRSRNLKKSNSSLLIDSKAYLHDFNKQNKINLNHLNL